MTLDKPLMLLATVMGLAALAGGSALAQPFREYGAKFSCSLVSADADVVKGAYATSINVHNPQGNATVDFIKKIVVANEEGAPVGRIVVEKDRLAPDVAERVDCPLIFKLLDASAKTHIEGFVVLEVPRTPGANIIPELDVVGKYSARGGAIAFQAVTYLGQTITK